MNKNRPLWSDNLANERTFLAWIRTAVSIMGFGFVVVKFSIFLKEVSLAINLPRPELVRPSVNSHIVGILLVSLGAVIIVFSYLRYRDTDSDIENGNDDNPKMLIKLLAVVLFFIGIILLIYLSLST